MTQPEVVGIGVIGLGFMGRAHVAAINEAAAAGAGCELRAVCDRNPDLLAGKSSTVDGNLAIGAGGALFDPQRVRGYTDLDAFLSDQRVRLVIVCTHTDSHVDVALACLAAGKHVLVEKPVSLQLAQVQRLDAAASEAWTSRGLRCMPGMCMRFWPGWDWLRDRITDRQYGPLRSLTLRRLGTTPSWAADFYANPERSGGAFGDLHIHDTDFISWALGTPRSVATRGSLMHCSTLYTFGSPAAAVHVSAEGGWDLTPGAGFRMNYLATFEHATAEFDLAREPRITLYRDGRAEPVEMTSGAGYLPQLLAFLDCVLDPALPLRATIADAVTTTTIMEAERRSMATGETVHL